MRKYLLISFLLVLVAGALSPAHADVPNALKTYVVWNQFDATVNTFQRIALIMSDSRYTGLFTGVIVIAMIIGGFYTFGRALVSGYNPLYGMLTWFGVIMMGVIVYLAFIRPTTQITIYDEALNETMTVGGVPEGIVFIAGLANTIERGFVDLIWTSGSPQSYRENAGGLTLTIYEKAFSGGVDLSGGSTDGQYINMSLRKYIEDCVYFEIRRPGSTININDFNTTTDFRTILANAQNPAIYTMWFDNTYRTGLTVTCTEDWQNHLAPYLNSLTNTSPDVQRFLNERCGEAGMGTNSQAGGGTNLVNVCVQKMEDMTTLLFGTRYSAAHLFRQYVIARALFDVYTESAPSSAISVVANRATGNSMIGMGIMANEWIPIIRSVVFSIFIGMIPFLCLLIPTPLFGRAMSFLFGIFVFLTVWTICDALVHSFAIDKTLDLFREISDGNLGFKSMMLFSTDSARALAAFGAARWSAIMLGGVFSSILVKFGGSALAHFAGNLSAFKQYGAQAAESVNNPSRWASEVQSLPKVMPSIAYANAGFRNVSTAMMYKAVSELETSLGATAALGGGNPVTAGFATARANVTGIKERVGHSAAISEYAKAHGLSENQVISAIQNYRVAASGGSARALYNLANELGISEYAAMDLIQKVRTTKEYGESKGLERAYERAVEKSGYTGSFSDYFAMQSELQSQRGYFDAAAVEKYSKMYSGGRDAFLRDQAEFRTSQAEAMLQKMRKSGLTPGAVAQFLGALQGMRNLVDSSVYAKVGDRGVWITRGGEQYNELSKMVFRKAIEDIARHGGMTRDTQEMFSLLRNDPLASAQLRAQASKMSYTVSPEEAFNMAQAFKRAGANVTASELSGSTVNASSYIDKSGQLHLSMVAVKKGERVAEVDMREGEFGTRSMEYNVRGFRGVKQDGAGVPYFANLYYTKGEDGNYYVLSGTRDRGITTTREGVFKTPDGITYIGREQYTSAPDKLAPNVREHTETDGGITLNSSFVSGNKVVYDSSKTISAGYVYKNYLSAVAEDKGHRRLGQGLGRSKGAIRDLGDYLSLRSLFRLSFGRPRGK